MDTEINKKPNSDRSAAIPGRSVFSDTLISDETLEPNTLTNNQQGSIPASPQNPNTVIDATSDFNRDIVASSNISAPPSSTPASVYSNKGARFADKRTRRKVVAIIIVILLLMLLVGGALFLAFSKKDEDPTNANRNKTVTNLSDEDLLQVTDDGGFAGAGRVTVNGPLEVNNRLVVNPSARPDNAEAGQLYFDQNTRQFTYYDGQNFQTLVSNLLFDQLSDFARANTGAGLVLAGGTLNNSGVLSLQGQTGDVSFNSGAGIGVNGTTINNTGVLSLQGSTGDVSLTAGSGIVLNGLQIINTGVTALSGTVDQVTVSAASGSIVLSLPQSIATNSAPTFGGLTLGSALGIGSGGTGNSSYNNNGVIYFDGTRFVSTPTPAAGLCLISNGSGVPVFGSCTGGSTVTSLNSLSGGINLLPGAGVTITTVGNNLEIAAPAAAGVTSLNGANGALTVANSTIAGSVITINDASTTTKGLAQFTAGDFGVTGGIVSLDSSVTKRGNTFNGANQLVLLDSSGFLPALNGSALTNLNANNIATGTLSVARGGTGVGSFTLNGVLYGNGTSGIQSTAAGTAGQCLIVNGSGVPVFGTCTGAGGVSSVNTKNGAVTIQGGTAIAVDNTGANIVLNNTGVTQLLGTANQVLVSSATGSITLSLPQAIGLTSNVVFNQMTLGQNGSSAGRLVLNGSTSNSVSLVAPASPSSGLTFTLPSADGAANQCLQTNGAGQLSFGTCLGGGSGGGISGAGTTNQLAKFTNGQTIGNSNISDDGTTVTVSSGAAIQGSAGLFLGTASVAGNLSLSDGSGNNTSLRAASTGSNLTFVLPNSTGANGQCIKTDGSGNLSFGNCLGGGSGGGVDSITGSQGGSVAASGPITINDALTTGSTITINTASNSVRGIASFSSSSFDVTAGAVTIKADGVALGTQTTGNYVASIAAGNGIQGSGASEGSTPTIALGPLTSDWNQSGAFDIVLANANAGIKIMGNTGTFYGSIDVGNLTADRTYTFPDSSGTVCLTSGNCIGSGGGVSSTGTDGYIAMFDGGSYVIADSIISQSGGAINVSGALTATSFQGNGSAISNIDAGNIATGTLATNRGGTGVDASAAANGQLLIGNGAGFSLATLTAGTGIVISNSAGGINISAPDSGTCSGCADSDDVVNSILGTAGGSAAVKGALTINNALTSGSTITINDATNAAKGIASFSSTYFDVASGAVSIKNDSIALGTNTTGNYVAGVSGGNGLTVTGSGSEGASVGVAINIQANKGLEVDGNGLSLIDCATDQVLKYNAGGQWICATDSAGGDGVNAIGTIDSAVKSANGAVVSGSNLILQTADVLRPGLVSTGAQSFAGAKTFTGAVGATSFSGDGFAVTNLDASKVMNGLLGTAYGGTGLNGSTAGNGQLLIGNGAGYSLATLTQGTGIVITNSAGGITISAPDSGTCSGCADSDDVVNSITGDAGGSATIKGILTINDALTSGNAITINTATNTVKGIASFSSTYFDVASGAVSIKDDSIALGTKTTGNYVAGVTGGNGLTVTGSGSEGAGVAVNLNLQANKGLEADSNGLSLIDCTTDQILKYNAGGQWICASDGSGVATIGSIDSQTKSPNGAVINGSELILQTADASNAGLVSTGTQTFAGAKTFEGPATFKNASDSAVAFQIQTAAGDTLFNADTTNNTLTVTDLRPHTAGIAVAGGKSTVDSAGNVGAGNSVVVGSDGFARIAYSDVTNGDLKYAQCLNANCSTSSIVTLDSTGNVGGYTDITLGSDGFARITYNDSTNNRVKFIQCTNASCSTNSVTTPVAQNTGRYSKVVMGTDGFARILTMASNATTARFIQCTNASCSTNVDTVIAATDVTRSLGLAIGPDGFARLAYGDDNTNTFRFIQCTNASCSTNTPTNVGSGGIGAMTLGNDGFARIAHGSTFEQCTNASCSTRVTTTLTPTINDAMAISVGSNGFARILTRVSADNSLNQITCTNADCSTRTNQVIDANTGTVDRASLALAADGSSRIAYHDAINGDLRFDSTLTSSITGTSIGGSSTPFGMIYATGLQVQGFSIDANNATSLTGSLTVTGATTLNGGLAVSGATSLNGTLAVTALGAADTTTVLCRNSLNQIATCGALPGVTGLGVIDSQTKSANGAVISGNNLILQTADATSVGLVSTGAQTFAGDKTFNDNLTFELGFTANNNSSIYGSLYVDDGLTVNGTTGLVVNSNGGATITDGGLNILNSGLYTNTVLRVTNAGALQNVTIAPNSTVKVGTTAGILYTDSNGTIQSLSLVGQNNNCVGLSSVGVVQFQGCSGSGGGLTNFTNGGNSFTNGNGTTATIRLTGNSFNSTIANPVLGLSSNSDLDILTNNISRIRVTSGGNVQILSGSTNSTEQFVVRNVSTGSPASTVYALRVDTSSDTFGRVGIGLLTGNAPQVRLDIGGNATSTGSTANGGLQVWASAAPGLSQGGSTGAGSVISGRIYFDEATGKFRVSENGGAWVNLIQTAGSAPILVGGNNGQNGSGGGGILTIGNTNANSSNTGTYGLLLGTANNNNAISSGFKIDYNGNYLFDKPYTDNDQYGFKIAGNGTGANGVMHVDTRYNVVAIGDISTNSTTSYGKLIVEGGAMITGGIRVGTGSEDIGLTLACSSSQQTVDSPQFKNGILVKHNGCRANNSDLAEAYNNHDGAEPGELVMMSSSSATTVERATQANNYRLAGIISTLPSQTLGTAQVPNGKPVALVGRVPAKVNLEGGAINVGDKITISSVAGVGKKATGRGMVVGTAMEAFNGSGIGSIEVFVNTSYYDPTDGANMQADAALFGDLNVSGMTTLTNLTVTGNAVFQGNITVAGHIISAGNTPEVTAVAGATATVEGTDTAGTITITVTSPLPAGALGTVAFDKTYSAAPRVNLTPDNAAAAGLKYYTTDRTPADFKIAAGDAVPAGTYIFNYQVIQ